MDDFEALLAPLRDERPANGWWKIACACLSFAAMVAIVALGWISYVGNPAVRHQNFLSQCRTNIAAKEATALDNIVLAALVDRDIASRPELGVALQAASNDRRDINKICK